MQRKSPPKPPTIAPIALGIEACALALGCSSYVIRTAIKQNLIVPRRLGGRTKILVTDLTRFFETLPEQHNRKGKSQ